MSNHAFDVSEQIITKPFLLHSRLRDGSFCSQSQAHQLGVSLKVWRVACSAAGTVSHARRRSLDLECSGRARQLEYLVVEVIRLSILTVSLSARYHLDAKP